MRNSHRLLVYALIISLVLTSAYLISAQQARQFQRRPINPEVIIQQRLERIVKQLNLSEKETAVLKPKIKGILKTRIDESLKMRQLLGDLRKAIGANDNAQIKAKLDLVKAQRKKYKTKLEKMEKELVKLLTVKQEAILTVNGIVNSDSSGFVGGFRSRQPQQPKRRLQQR